MLDEGKKIKENLCMVKSKLEWIISGRITTQNANKMKVISTHNIKSILTELLQMASMEL